MALKRHEHVNFPECLNVSSYMYQQQIHSAKQAKALMAAGKKEGIAPGLVGGQDYNCNEEQEIKM